MQLAVDAFEIFRTIAGVQIHLAFESGEIDLAVTRAQVYFPLVRHLDDDVDAMIAPSDGEVVMRVTHINLDRIAVLMLFDADAAFADLVAFGDDFGFNRILVPGRDADVGVGRLDAQFGLAGQVVSLRPFVGASGFRGKHGDDSNGQDSQRQTLHGS